MVIPSFGSLVGFSLPTGISRLKFFNRLAKIKKFSTRATDSPRHFRRPEKKNFKEKCWQFICTWPQIFAPVPKVKSHQSCCEARPFSHKNRSGLNFVTSEPQSFGSCVIEYRFGNTIVPASIMYVPTFESTFGLLTAAIGPSMILLHVIYISKRNNYLEITHRSTTPNLS